MNTPTSFSLRCTAKVFETTDAVTLTLEGHWPHQAKPGQYVILGVDIDGERCYRAYSLCAPSDDNRLQVTIKKVPQGKVSTYVVDVLSEGEMLDVSAPMGQFNCVDIAHHSQVLLLSAGSGVTPLMAMARHWQTIDNPPQFHFIHCAPNAEEMIFAHALTTLADKGQASLVYTRAHAEESSQQPPKQDAPTSVLAGRLTQAQLLTLCPDIAHRSVFICGPEAFMADATQWVTNLGCTSVYQEHFSGPATSELTPELEVLESAQSDSVVKIAVPSFGVEQEVAQGSALIDGLEAAQLPVIAACRSGVCGSCKCKVESGEVTTTSQETLSEEEIAAGYVLACSSHIVSDVVVSLG
uniref:flavin reductase family protein n=1 Tax=Thaumasiovibrio occultus TaxID=1891184 RepID=UPI000B3526E2|nr:iron-sulfur cluster-binding domain-containing protein [Thaumasiovibrio occultus]